MPIPNPGSDAEISCGLREEWARLGEGVEILTDGEI